MPATPVEFTAAQPIASSPGPLVDVADPEAGISDPLAGTPVLDRNCADGQVDVNTATAHQIAGVLGLASGPAVEKVIKGRPWLRAVDIISVPGVPVSAAERIAASGCATPTTLPEPAPLACTTTEQVDLQVASVDQIVTSLKVARPTAERLVANRPLPQALEQVIAPRTPGLTLSIISSMRSTGRMCVTPVPFTYAATSWRWVGAGGAVVTADGHPEYALIVPPNAVTNPGAWARVTPQLEADMPTADLNLYRSFVGELAGRLPAPNGIAPIFFHDAADGLRVSMGGSVSVVGGTIVAPLRSLSTVSTSGRDGMCDMVEPDTNFLCNALLMPRDGLLDELGITSAMIDANVLRAQAAPFYNESESPCPAGPRIRSTGKLATGLFCSAGIGRSLNEAEWTLSNGTGSTSVWGLIQVTGLFYEIRYLSGVPLGPEYTPPTSDSSLSNSISMAITNGGGLAPGVDVTFRKNAGDAHSKYAFHSLNPGHQTGGFALMNLAKIADLAQSLAGLGFRSLPLDCAQKVAEAFANPASPTRIEAAVGCTKDQVDQVVDAAILAIKAAAGDNPTPGQKKALGNLTGASTVLKAASYTTILGDYALTLVGGVAGSFSDGELTMEFIAPTPPPSTGQPSGGGSANPGGSPMPDGGLIVKVSNGPASYFVDGAGVAHHIPDGGTYQCLADRYPVRYHLDPSRLGAFAPGGFGADATCPSTPVVVVSPDTTSGAYGFRNVLLRRFDGAAWIVDGNGYRVSIVDGASFNCFAESYLVWDELTTAEIERFTPDSVIAGRFCTNN